MLAAETFVDLLKSPAHWYFELFLMLIFDVVIGLVLWPRVKAHFHEDIKHADHDHEPDHHVIDHEGEVNRSIPTVQEVFRVIDLEEAITVALYHLEKEDPGVAAKVLSVAIDKKGE